MSIIDPIMIVQDGGPYAVEEYDKVVKQRDELAKLLREVRETTDGNDYCNGQSVLPWQLEVKIDEALAEVEPGEDTDG